MTTVVAVPNVIQTQRTVGRNGTCIRRRLRFLDLDDADQSREAGAGRLHFVEGVEQ